MMGRLEVPLCARSSADRAVDFESKGRKFESCRARFLILSFIQRFPSDLVNDPGRRSPVAF
jgi:hypothetical protein